MPAASNPPAASPASRPVPRREAILRAALETWTMRGYAGASIDEVRRRSGASTGSVYHHFASKEELFGALYVEGLADYQRGVRELLARRPAPRGGIQAIVRHHLEWTASNRELARFLLGGREAEVKLASDARLRALNRDFFRTVEGWLEPHMQVGRIRRLPLDVFYSVLLGPSQEFTRQWLAGRANSSLSAARQELADAAWRSLKPTEGG